MIKSEEMSCACEEPRRLLHTAMAQGAPGHNRRLVAYIKVTPDSMAQQAQQKLIDDYCREHGNQIVHSVIDQCNAGGGMSLDGALNLLSDADGLIVADLDALVSHEQFRTRDLLPLLKNFLCSSAHKRLISVIEGVDTQTPGGQIVALEIVNQLKDAAAGM